MTHIHQRGWMDTADNIRTAFQDDRILRELKTRHADWPLTHDKLDVVTASKWAYLIANGSYRIAGGRVPDQYHLHAVSIGELLAPVLPDNYFLPTDRANEMIRKILVYYADNDTSLNRVKTKVTFIAAHNRTIADGSQEGVGLIEIDPLMSTRDFVQVYGKEFSDFLLMPSSADVQLAPIDIFTTLYIAVAKRGNVTEDFLSKVVRGLLDDLQYDAKISTETITFVYRFYGGFITADNARLVMDQWLNDIPEIALRVRLTLQQATNSGLTALVTSGRAMKKYPDFPWAKLNGLTGGELANFQAAVTAVGGNQYYGFNKTLGVARSTLYSSISYIAKELLITLNGEVSLRRYAGWIRSPKNAAVVKALIDAYKQTYLQRMETGEASAEDAAITNNVITLLNNEANVDLFA